MGGAAPVRMTKKKIELGMPPWFSNSRVEKSEGKRMKRKMRVYARRAIVVILIVLNLLVLGHSSSPGRPLVHYYVEILPTDLADPFRPPRTLDFD